MQNFHLHQRYFVFLLGDQSTIDMGFGSNFRIIVIIDRTHGLRYLYEAPAVNTALFYSTGNNFGVFTN